MPIEIKRSRGDYIWENGTPLLFISNKEIEDLIIDLILQIEQSRFKPDLIISVAQSGVFLGEALAKILDLPHAIFRAKAYNSIDNNHQEIKHQVIIAANSLLIDEEKKLNYLPQNFTPFYEKILLVDHLADSGDTLQSIQKEINRRHLGDYFIHTACLWLKVFSKYVPNYYGTKIYPEPQSGKMPWIVEPKDMIIKQVKDKLKVKTFSQ